MADMDLGIDKSPEELARMFEQAESGNEVTLPDPNDTHAKPASEAEPKPAAAAEASDVVDAEKDAAGVATKDGKHVIPYSVLKGERDRATKAEQAAKEAADRIAALEAVIAASANGAKPGDPAPTGTDVTQQAQQDLSDEDLELLKEDFPTVYKTLTAAMAKVSALEAKLAPVEARVQSDEATERREAADQVQDAIDAVPKLAHIQATNAEAFELAKQFDAAIRERPAWAGKPLSERFAKVTEMVEAALGPIVLPGSVPPMGDAKAAAKAKAEAALRKAAGQVPSSLSEFPAGQNAAQDEAEAAANMTPMQLAEKFAGMTPEQMDAYFQTL